eukprot:TRINITY_DN6712_c0_g1_i2.p1 TRINITY_DN6712_c0_g1~~TRINITY_DN6712_c0_g1_i2.p1  ORF type:complete len:1800 (-),score=429.51 TRINITY_DN6712_c0_g1_i2:80-5020(-)
MANKQQEQKYLPAPRIRRTSEESTTKSTTPQVRRKARKSSEDAKISLDKTTKSKQNQVESLKKISAAEGEDVCPSEQVQNTEIIKKKTEPSKIRTELAKDMKNETKIKDVENLIELDIALTNFMNFEFKYVGTKNCVQVAGTFNDWTPEDLHNNSGDVWSRNIRLPLGTFQFKYLVDGVWMHDPLYPTICDQEGIPNNVIYVGEPKRKNSVLEPMSTMTEALESPITVAEPVVEKIEIFLESKEIDVHVNHLESGLTESNPLADQQSLEGLAAKAAEQAKTPHEVKDVTQGLINNIHETEIAPKQEQLPKEKAHAIEIASTTQNSIVSDKLNSVTNITSGDSNVEKNGGVKEPAANESLSTTHGCSMEIIDTTGQETSEPQDLKKQIMGNTKSVQNAENFIPNELLINVVNENIKKICLYPAYKSSDQTQSIIKQVLDLVVKSGDPKELHENMANEKLQIFLNPLSEAEIRKLCEFSNKENDPKELIITPLISDKELPHKGTESKLKLKDIINENIRIVRKSPSYTHDQITQISVKKVLEIIGSTTDEEEILENLQDLSLEFFTEPEKSQFWLLKEESLDSCITMGSIENTRETQQGIVDKYLIENKENPGLITYTNKLGEKDPVEENKIQEKTEEPTDITEKGEDKADVADNNTGDSVKQSPNPEVAGKVVTVDYHEGSEIGNTIDDSKVEPIVNNSGNPPDPFNQSASDNPSESINKNESTSVSSTNSYLEYLASPLSENVPSIVDKHLGRSKASEAAISNVEVSEVCTANTENMAEDEEEKKNQVTQNPTTKDCSRDANNKESFATDNVTSQNNVSLKQLQKLGTENIDTDIAFDESLDKEGGRQKDFLEPEGNNDQIFAGTSVDKSQTKDPSNQLEIENDKEQASNKNSISEISTGSINSEPEKIQAEENTSKQENFDEEAHQKEKERVNLVGIINKNISKYCKEKDYGANETAQRKVRTIFNIITEAVSAEEIYDKILLEGLQYFAEFHGDEQVKNKNSLSDASPVLKHQERSPSVTKRTDTERKDSIVSKILKEVNTPKQSRKHSPAISPKIKKSQTFAGQMKDENKEKDKSGKCSITRDKASRQVRKYVRTSVSSVNLDQLDQDLMKDGIEFDEKKESPVKENLLDVKELTLKAVEQDLTIEQDKNSPGQSLEFEKEVNKPSIENKNEILMNLNQNILGEKLEEMNEDKGIKQNVDVTKEHSENCTISVTLVNELENNDINSDALGENDKNLEIDLSSNILHSNNSLKCENTFDRDSRGLSIENIERRQIKQEVQRSFAEALTHSKDKKKNHQKDKLPEDNSIVSRLLKEKGSIENMQGAGIKIQVQSPEETMKTEVTNEKGIRDRTISECSDNLPDLCPITNDDEDMKEILDEELWQKIHQSEKEAKGVSFSVEDDVEIFDEEGRRNSIFMTDFDDETENDSDNESFADAEDTVIDGEESLPSTNVLEPKIRIILQDILSKVFDEKCECSSKRTFKSEDIEAIVSSLVTHIIDMVGSMGARRSTNNLEHNGGDILEEEGKQSESEKAFETSDTDAKEIDGNGKERVDSETELEECETVYDVFDLSMKRLDFIEHSFKTIYTSPNTKEDEDPAAAEPIKSVEDKMRQIREILTSQADSEEKLKAIEEIVKECSPVRGNK